MQCYSTGHTRRPPPVASNGEEPRDNDANNVQWRDIQKLVRQHRILKNMLIITKNVNLLSICEDLNLLLRQSLNKQTFFFCFD